MLIERTFSAKILILKNYIRLTSILYTPDMIYPFYDSLIKSFLIILASLIKGFSSVTSDRQYVHFILDLINYKLDQHIHSSKNQN